VARLDIAGTRCPRSPRALVIITRLRISLQRDDIDEP